jgi:hypothetical protein
MVSADGRQIVPDAGVELKRVTCYILGPVETFVAAILRGLRGGEPVDLGTGLFTLEKTDLVVPDVIRIVISRAHRAGDPTPDQLGHSNFDYQIYLTGDATNWTFAELVLADILRPQGEQSKRGALHARARSQAAVLFMSGYTDNAVIHHHMLEADRAYSQKPFSRDDVARAVRRAPDTRSHRQPAGSPPA